MTLIWLSDVAKQILDLSLIESQGGIISVSFDSAAMWNAFYCGLQLHSNTR